MENFSNSLELYFQQIITELSDQENNKWDNIQFRYIEVGQLLTHGFSIIQFKQEKTHLKHIVWNAEFDNSRFNKGIYNLDRLSFSTHEISLTAVESEQLEKLLALDLELIEINNIVLDGWYCQFEKVNQRLVWNTNQEINDHLIHLIEFLRKKANR